MNVKDDYMWRNNGHNRRNNPLLPGNVRAIIIGKNNCGKTTFLLNLLLQLQWLHYNQQEYQILKKGCENGLTKKQVGNIFLHQNLLACANLSPLQAIDEFDGIRDGGVKADLYNGCMMIPDPADLNAREKNLLILDDCFLVKQNIAEAYYTRGRHNNCDTFVRMRILSFCFHKMQKILIIDHCDDDMSIGEFKRFRNDVWNGAGNHNCVTIDLTSGKMNGKYRTNLDYFYLPARV